MKRYTYKSKSLLFNERVSAPGTRRGSVTVEVEGAAYLLQPGDVLTIDAFQHHRYAGGSADGLQLMLTIDDRMLYRQPGEHYTLATVGAGALPKEEPVFTTLRKSIGRICQ